jgi:hypothetical protein
LPLPFLKTNSKKTDMCLSQPITTANCPKGRAGISKIWVAPCENVTQLVFNNNRQITGIFIDPLLGGFTSVDFQKNTASFEQARTRVGNGTNVAQTITFIEPGQDATMRRLLEDLSDCCCYHVIVRDNTGQLHYAGISYFTDTNTWQSEDMRTGEGSANTGADPTADSSQYNETMTANVVFYAPFTTVPQNLIP